MYYIDSYHIHWDVFKNKSLCISLSGRSPCGVVDNELDHNMVVSEFQLQLHYYIHFQINTLWKGMNPLFPLAMG